MYLQFLENKNYLKLQKIEHFAAVLFQEVHVNSIFNYKSFLM